MHSEKQSHRRLEALHTQVLLVHVSDSTTGMIPGPVDFFHESSVRETVFFCLCMRQSSVLVRAAAQLWCMIMICTIMPAPVQSTRGCVELLGVCHRV